MSTVVPMPRHVAVLRTEAETVTPGGILLPDAAQKKATRGTVVGVYNPCEDPSTGRKVTSRLKEGDVVIFKKYAGEEFEIGKTKLLFMSEDEVLGTIRD